MLLASVHLPLFTTIPIALAFAALLIWYWTRLGDSEVPPSRRKVRRFSLAIMLISLPLLVGALSVIDPTPINATAEVLATAKRQYAVAWTIITFMVLVMIASALMDAINNLRILQNQRHDEVTKAAVDLALAIQERRREAAARTAGRPTDAPNSSNQANWQGEGVGEGTS